MSPDAPGRAARAGSFPVGGTGTDMLGAASSGLRVLVVDDEPNITDLLATALRFVGYEVDVANSGRAALEAVGAAVPDLIVLDVMMPDYDGFAVCERVRADGVKAPVIFLTARDATEDKISGLRIGGDDYMTKPFSLEELMARIHAILRRAHGDALPGVPASRLVFEDLVMDIEQHQVWRADEAISLSPTEFRLLRYLLANPNRVMSKAQILDHVWEYDFDGDGNVVETYISYLRRKIDANRTPLIHTVRGVGYALRRPRS